MKNMLRSCLEMLDIWKKHASESLVSLKVVISCSNVSFPPHVKRITKNIIKVNITFTEFIFKEKMHVSVNVEN